MHIQQFPYNHCRLKESSSWESAETLPLRRADWKVVFHTLQNLSCKWLSLVQLCWVYTRLPTDRLSFKEKSPETLIMVKMILGTISPIVFPFWFWSCLLFSFWLSPPSVTKDLTTQSPAPQNTARHGHRCDWRWIKCHSHHPATYAWKGMHQLGKLGHSNCSGRGQEERACILELIRLALWGIWR